LHQSAFLRLHPRMYAYLHHNPSFVGIHTRRRFSIREELEATELENPLLKRCDSTSPTPFRYKSWDFGACSECAKRMGWKFSESPLNLPES
jgi:hypothetical protein